MRVVKAFFPGCVSALVFASSVHAQSYYQPYPVNYQRHIPHQQTGVLPVPPRAGIAQQPTPAVPVTYSTAPNTTFASVPPQWNQVASTAPASAAPAPKPVAPQIDYTRQPLQVKPQPSRSSAYHLHQTQTGVPGHALHPTVKPLGGGAPAPVRQPVYQAQSVPRQTQVIPTRTPQSQYLASAKSYGYPSVSPNEVLEAESMQTAHATQTLDDFRSQRTRVHRSPFGGYHKRPEPIVKSPWYGALRGELNWVEDYEFSQASGTNTILTDNEFDGGLGINAAVGFQGHSNARFELEGGYRQINGDRTVTTTLNNLGVATAQTVANNNLDLEVFTAMANLYVDMPIPGYEYVAPYIGGGVGTAVEVDEGELTIAYQGMVGVNLYVTEQTAIGAGYRYFEAPDIIENSAGDYDMESHIVEVGVKTHF